MRELRKNEVMLKNVRLAFGKLWKPDSSVEGGVKKFGGVLLIDPDENADDWKALKAAAKFAAEDCEKPVPWPFKPKNLDRRCYGRGEDQTNEEGEVYDGFEGMFYVKARNPERFPIVDRKPSKALVQEDGKPYNGCYVNALIRFYAINDKARGGAGIFASMEALQFWRDGEAFGNSGPVDPTDVFGAFSDEDEDEDEYADADDDMDI